MIKFIHGDLFQSETEAIVNPVNCMGTMGRGLAAKAKLAYPENYKLYKSAFVEKKLKIGEMLVFVSKEELNPKYIINFPTKYDWRESSKIEYIVSGLYALVCEIERLSIKSISIPALGCGLGGLNWDDVMPIIIDSMNLLNDIDVHIYEPWRWMGVDVLRD